MKLTRKELYNILGIFLAWRLALQLIGFLANARLFLNKDIAYAHLDPWWINGLPKFLQYFVKWDSGFYLEIANKGYFFDQVKQLYNAAFFPLYPLLIKIFSFVFHNNVVSGLIISSLSTLGACFFLYRLAKFEFNKNIAYRSVLYFLIFPSAVFLISIYTESLFIFLALASFYFARTTNWKWAGVFGFFAALCRPIGIILFPVLILEYLEQNNFKFNIKKFKNYDIKKLAWLLLIPAGLASYMTFLWIRFKDAFLFLKAQSAWDRKIGFSLINLWKTFTSYFHDLFWPGKDFSFFLRNDIEFLFFITFLILSIFVFLKLRKSYGLYCLLALLIPFLTCSFISMARFCLVLFPVFILLAKLSIRRVWLNYGIIILFSMMLSLFTIMFVNWYWIG